MSIAKVKKDTNPYMHCQQYSDSFSTVTIGDLQKSLTVTIHDGGKIIVSLSGSEGLAITFDELHSSISKLAAYKVNNVTVQAIPKETSKSIRRFSVRKKR